MIEAALYDLLTSDTAVTAFIAARLYPLVAPQGESRPAVTYQRISGVRSMPLNGPNGFVVARYQLNAFAEDAERAVGLSDAIRNRLNGFHGSVSGHHIQRIWPDGDPHAYEYNGEGGERLVVRVIQDYRIAYAEAFTELAELTPGAVGNGIEPATVTFPIAADVTLVGLDPTTNYDGTTPTRSIRVGRGPTGFAADKRRPIIRVDVSAIPSGATVTEAHLDLTCWFTESTGAAKLYRVLQTAWIEDQATWNVYATGLSWGAAGLLAETDYTVTGGVDWNKPASTGAFMISGLAALVQDAVDNRAGQLHFILISVDESTVNTDCGFRQSEYITEAERPLLTVSYE